MDTKSLSKEARIFIAGHIQFNENGYSYPILFPSKHSTLVIPKSKPNVLISIPTNFDSGDWSLPDTNSLENNAQSLDSLGHYTSQVNSMTNINSLSNSPKHN